MRLPGWVTDNRTAVAREVSTARDQGPQERLAALRAACAAGAKLLALHDAPQRILDWVDPLPESSKAVLARLRKQHRRRA